MLISLARIKTHLRLPPDADAELDAELERIHDAAIGYASDYTGRDLVVEFGDACSSSCPDQLPATIEQACLLLIADWYENREQTVIGTITAELPAANRLLHFNRIGLGI